MSSVSTWVNPKSSATFLGSKEGDVITLAESRRKVDGSGYLKVTGNPKLVQVISEDGLDVHSQPASAARRVFAFSYGEEFFIQGVTPGIHSGRAWAVIEVPHKDIARIGCYFIFAPYDAACLRDLGTRPSSPTSPEAKESPEEAECRRAVEGARRLLTQAQRDEGDVMAKVQQKADAELAYCLKEIAKEDRKHAELVAARKARSKKS